MFFHHWQSFLHMGGYANYIWSAYGFVTFAALTTAVVCRFRLRRIRRLIEKNHA